MSKDRVGSWDCLLIPAVPVHRRHPRPLRARQRRRRDYGASALGLLDLDTRGGGIMVLPPWASSTFIPAVEGLWCYRQKVLQQTGSSRRVRSVDLWCILGLPPRGDVIGQIVGASKLTHVLMSTNTSDTEKWVIALRDHRVAEFDAKLVHDDGQSYVVLGIFVGVLRNLKRMMRPSLEVLCFKQLCAMGF